MSVATKSNSPVDTVMMVIIYLEHVEMWPLSIRGSTFPMVLLLLVFFLMGHIWSLNVIKGLNFMALHMFCCEI